MQAELEEDQKLGVITEPEGNTATGADEEIVAKEADNEPEEDQVVISIGEESLTPEDDEEYKSAPAWVKDLRKAHREEKRKSKELERKLKEMESSPRATAPSEPLGKKPTLEDCDWNSEKYEAAVASWLEKKKAKDEEQRQKELESRRFEDEQKEKLSKYEQMKRKLNLADFETAEDAVLQSLTPMQQSIILAGAVDPALMVYAIGKSKKRADELSKIQDPVRFAVEIGKLETQLKVTRKTAKTAPEKVVSGSSRNSGGVDSTLERLRAEADKTGDRSKVIAYMRKLKSH